MTDSFFQRVLTVKITTALLLPIPKVTVEVSSCVICSKFSVHSLFFLFRRFEILKYKVCFSTTGMNESFLFLRSFTTTLIVAGSCVKWGVLIQVFLKKKVANTKSKSTILARILPSQAKQKNPGILLHHWFILKKHAQETPDFTVLKIYNAKSITKKYKLFI